MPELPSEDRDDRPTPAGPLTVLMIVRSFGFPDGMAATRRLQLMGEALSAQGVTVKALCTQANEPIGSTINLRPRGTFGPIQFEYVTGRTVRPSSFLLRRLVDVRGFLTLTHRVVTARFSETPLAVYLWISPQQRTWYRAWVLRLLRFLHVPCVVELNEPPWTIGATRLAVRKSPLYGVAGVVAISVGLHAWAVAEFTRLGREGSVIRVPAVARASSDPSRCPTTSSAGSFLMACSLGYRDLIEFVIESMSIVWESHECDLVLTGFSSEDPRAAWLRDHPVYVAHQARIRVLGYVTAERLSDEYSMCSALLAPLSNEERSSMRFPSKIAEYLLSGRPVITSNIGDVGMYLTDGETALVAEPDDSAGFAARIIAVLENPGAASVIGEAGHALALKEFEVAQYGEVVFGLFGRVVGHYAGLDTAPSAKSSQDWSSRR